jgi:hypothetical protein
VISPRIQGAICARSDIAIGKNRYSFWRQPLSWLAWRRGWKRERRELWQTARLRGYTAYYGRKTIEDNPYSSLTQLDLGTAWAIGWCCASLDDLARC